MEMCQHHFSLKCQIEIGVEFQMKDFQTRFSFRVSFKSGSDKVTKRDEEHAVSQN